MEQQVMNWAAAALGATGGFLMRTLWRNVDRQQERITQIEVLVAGQYMPRHEMNERFDAITTKLDAIFEKLDTKVDKADCERWHNK